MRGLMASMIIGTIFGWVWLFVAFTEDSSFPRWFRIVITVIAIILGIWITYIKRKTQFDKLSVLKTDDSMFKTRSYRLIVIGEILLIVIAIFILKLVNLQNFITFAIAMIMALHFILLGWSLRTNNLQIMGWIMVAIIIICDIIFAPISKQISVENWVLIGFGMGVVLWGNVLITAVRIRNISRSYKSFSK
jgi:hypothetical protein